MLETPRISEPVAALDLLDCIRAIGHDVGAPIRHVRGFTALLEEEVGAQLNAEARALLDQVISSSELAEGMLRGIHDLAYIGRCIEKESVPSLLNLVQNARDQVGRSELSLVVEGDASAATDPILLTRAIAHLMRNTLVYANEPQMTISIAQDANYARMTLADQGPAFSQEDWTNALKPFRRLRNRPTTNALGLGLTEVQHIASTLDIQLSAKALPGTSLAVELRVPKS